MDILLVASTFNSLSQRVYAELSEHGHRVDVVLAAYGADEVRAAVRELRPELIIAPMLKTALPEDVWRENTCLIVHPGPPGDRGPSSLDWAIAEEVPRWGVTVLQAEAAMDAGAVWAAVPFSVPPVGKSDLYRNEASDAAVAAVRQAVQRYADGSFKPRPQSDPSVRVVWRDFFRQERRRIDWEGDSTETVLRKLRGADSQPGVLDELLGREVFLHGGHRRTGCAAVPATCSRRGPEPCAGPPGTARSGSPKSDRARARATRRPSGARRPQCWPRCRIRRPTVSLARSAAVFRAVACRAPRVLP